MSIFKETFRPFVFKQLRIREAIVKQGNNSTTDGSNRHANEGGGGRFGNPRADVETSAGVKEKMTLPAGSFFTNTVVKQCTIRMCSGVDLREDNKILKEGKFERSKDLINEGLAIRYILEGGIPTKSIDFARKRNLKTGGKHFSVPRGDLRKGGYDNPNFGKQYGASYGDPYIRSDAKDGFGMVPMPGIIDANIRTKTAYGSLREAKVNFVCHNRRQLEIMELLYMRPGYPVLLEWGWTPYISNEGKKEEAFPYLIEFFKQESKINDLQLKILNRKKSSGGNYDGFIGYCKNFDIKSREDGGYDCSTEIIAMGEVLEGLKGKRDGLLLKKEKELYEVDNLEYYLRGIVEFIPAIFNLQDAQDAMNGISNDPFRKQDLFRKLVEITRFIVPDLDIRDLTVEEQAVLEAYANSRETGYNPTPWSDEFAMYARLQDEFYSDVIKFKEAIKNLVIEQGKEVGVNGYGYVEGSRALHSYIRWDFLTIILNKFVFPDTSTDREISSDSSEIEPITQITNYRDPLGATPELLEYSPNPLSRQAQSILTSFTNQQTWWEYFFGGGDETYTTNVREISDISIDPEVCLLPHQITVPTVVSRDTGDSITLSQLNPRKTAYVFFNVDFLLKKFMELRYTNEVINDDFNMFDWIKNIWDGVNLSCVNTHKFTLQTELERPNIARIVDLNFDTKLKPEDLFEVKIQSNESIVRDFTFNTTLPSSIGATIAIAAQAPKDIETLDSVTFAAFHQNTRYRFNKDEEEEDLHSKPDFKKWKDKVRAKYEREQRSFRKSLQRLLAYSLSIIGIPIHVDLVGTKSEASNTIKSIEKRARWLDQHYSFDGAIPGRGVVHYKGQLKPDIYKNSLERSAIIPLKFTAQMDGIGGIVIGNVFKVQKNRLPMGYQGNEVAFVVMGENQKITAGQDWTTDITGQLVLLDLEKEIPPLPPIATPPPPPPVVEDPPPPPPEMLIVDGDMPIIIQRINKDIITPPPGNTQRFEFPDVNFDTDKSELKDEAKEALDEFAEYMNAHSSYTVDISGHTDSVGSETYNQSLSERRAKAVKDYFINVSGIDPSRLTSRGMGELEPIDTNDTSEGRSNNRRTVFLVQNPDGDVPMNVYHTL